MSKASGASRISPWAVSIVVRREERSGSPGCAARWALFKSAEHQALELLARDRRDRARDVGQRVGAGRQPHALMIRRQEIGVPDLEPVIWVLGGQDDERRQIGVERAQSVADPRAQAGHRDRDRAGEHAERRRRVAGRIAVDRVQEAKLVDDRAHVVEQLADHLAALAPRPELVWRAQHLFLALEHGLVVVLLELRLVVERVDLRDAAGHEEDDQVLGPGREVAGPRGKRVPAVHVGGQGQALIEAQTADGRRGRGSP